MKQMRELAVSGKTAGKKIYSLKEHVHAVGLKTPKKIISDSNLETRTVQRSNESLFERFNVSKDRDACGVGIFGTTSGVPTNYILQTSLTMLSRMDHRGATGADPFSSDGVGIMTDIPHDLFKSEIADLPNQHEYGVGFFFVPKGINHSWKETVSIVCSRLNFEIITWRNVSVNNEVLGEAALNTAPEITQLFIKPSKDHMTGSEDKDSLERSLYVLRRNLEFAFSNFKIRPYIVSFSTDNIVYKGMMLSHRLGEFYADLSHSLYKTRYAMVHQRFSTNTTPKWHLAQPFRTIAHNGEINTLRGNINSLAAREISLDRFNPNHKLANIGSSIDKELSDSGIFDSAIERDLYLTKNIYQTLLGFSPDPYESEALSASETNFFQQKSLSREAWDGPAFIGFSNMGRVGAKLDRNGLRPARYTITNDGYFLVSSEQGVVDFNQDTIAELGRLGPGEAISVNLNTGSVLKNNDIRLSAIKSFNQDTVRPIIDVDSLDSTHAYDNNSFTDDHASAFGYSKEDVDKILIPMSKTASEPLGSMGNDTALAVLSNRPRLIYDYFKQIFAQVTNPAIDAIREKNKTSLTSFLGMASCEMSDSQTLPAIALSRPLISKNQFHSILTSDITRNRISEILAVFHDDLGLQGSLEVVCNHAVASVLSGKDIIVLDDSKISETVSPIPMLLAVSAVHHHLIKTGFRTKTSILVKSHEAREVHHFATLMGFGANGIFPELASNLVSKRNADIHAEDNYLTAASEGVRKIMSKLGISTMRSYQGAQTFEIVGLGKKVVDEYFTWTTSKIGGIDLSIIEKEALSRKNNMYTDTGLLSYSGMLSWRRNGESRLHTPSAVLSFQKAIKLNSKEAFNEFCDEIDNKSGINNLRNLMEIDYSRTEPIDISEVESVESIAKRFTTGAMSLGSISKEAHETIAIAMNRLGAKSNSGEGGELPQRAKLLSNGDSKRSAIKQVASGRFGVNTAYLSEADEIQIKIAQGAKPGEGGQLPGHKVTFEIGEVRGSTPGVSLISPPPHHDIYSIEDLAQLIYDLKSVNPEARISVKLVSGTGIGTIAAGVAKAKADAIIISGGDGGTGASPLNSLFYAGLPWEIGADEVHQVLSENNLRSRVKLQVDGGLRTPNDMLIASILGAEEWGLGSVALMSIGCVMMRQCHLNTCPVGIATQNEELRRYFTGVPENLVTYITSLSIAIREKLSEIGVKSVSDLVGRKDLLKKKSSCLLSDKQNSVDLSQFVSSERNYLLSDKTSQDHGLEQRFDNRVLMPVISNDIKEGRPTFIEYAINNLDRSIGSIASGYLVKNNSDHQIQMKLTGTAGQSFMAYSSKHFSVELTGQANDYVGKGLSGSIVAIKPETTAITDPVLIGNTALYGATSGGLYVAGTAGERFAVRNSGATAVVEGVGQHALEYMTGGTVVILGEYGLNLGAGMSGGVAYVFDPFEEIETKMNPAMIGAKSKPNDEEYSVIFDLIKNHKIYTDSSKATSILNNWHNMSKFFVKIEPLEYKKALNDLGKNHKVELPNMIKKPVNSFISL